MTPDLPIHRPSVDLARLLAAFGIVWAHAHAPGHEIGYVALALFLVLAGSSPQARCTGPEGRRGSLPECRACCCRGWSGR